MKEDKQLLCFFKRKGDKGVEIKVPVCVVQKFFPTSKSIAPSCLAALRKTRCATVPLAVIQRKVIIVQYIGCLTLCFDKRAI